MGDYKTVNKLLSTASAAMLVLSVIGLVPVSLFSSQIAKACGVPEHFLRASAWSISILALFYALSNAGGAYEAIILGAHRVDICRKLATVTCVLEAVGIIWASAWGTGLVAMACVIAMSEVVWVGYCYFASRRVLPQVRISARDVSKSVARELLRFVGSYQLLSVLQVTYGAVVPIAVLRTFGANSTGVLAIATRLISPVSMCQYAFLVPILSASAMVYTSGSVEEDEDAPGEVIQGHADNVPGSFDAHLGFRHIHRQGLDRTSGPPPGQDSVVGLVGGDFPVVFFVGYGSLQDFRQSPHG